MTKTKATLSGSRVSKEAVLAVPAPEFTPTWHPHPHSDVVACMHKACEKLELEVIREEYAMTKTEQRMFAVFEMSGKGDEETNLAAGLRHSIDKTLSIGMCAGERVFICDNLIMESNFVLFRKHTGRLSIDEMELMAVEALGRVVERFDVLKQWHDSLKAVNLTDQQAALLIASAMRQKESGNAYQLFPPSYYPMFDDLYFGEESKYNRSLHGLHGAITEIYTKERALVHLPDYNAKLQRFIDHEAPALLKSGERVKFSEIETAAREVERTEREEARLNASEAAGWVREEVQKKQAALKKEKKKDKIKEAVKAKPKKKAEKKIVKPKKEKPVVVEAKKIVTVKESKPKGKQKQMMKCHACKATVFKDKKCSACGEKL